MSWNGQGRWDRNLTVLLVLAVVGAMGTLGYVIAEPKVGERFTEFYILGPDGKAEGYHGEVALEDNVRLILGIVNREHETTLYRAEITINGERVGGFDSITLAHEEKWEQEVSFTPTRAGPDQKVEFLLYKEGVDKPYQMLHFWINVAEAP